MRMVRTCMLAALLAYSQVTLSNDEPCYYALKELIKKVEVNYAGYADNHNDSIERATNTLFDEIEKQSPQNCLPYLEQWLSNFSDPYLKIYPQDIPFSTKENSETTPPTLHWLADDVALLKLPSFHASQRQNINDLIKGNDAKLKQADGLIVDLRGNTDGHFFVLETLLPLIGVFEFKSRWHVLASEDNLQFFTRLLKRDLVINEPKYFKRYAALVADMNTYPNTLIEFAWPWDSAADTQANIEKIFVIQDNGVGGAAEEFILAAKSNSRVTTFGVSTRGKLDYVTPVPHGIFDAYQVFIPAKKRVWISEGRINNHGIKPDVTVDITKEELGHYLYLRYMKRS